MILHPIRTPSGRRSATSQALHSARCLYRTAPYDRLAQPSLRTTRAPLQHFAGFAAAKWHSATIPYRTVRPFGAPNLGRTRPR